VLEFFSKKQQKGERYLQLTGGEIFLHPDIFEIIQLGLSFGYTLRLQTNGFLFNKMGDEKLRILSSKKVMIKISLDGWNQETHEFYRAKGSFNKVIAGIKIIRRHNQNIGIKTVVHTLNFPEIYRMLDMCLYLGARGFSYNILRPEGRGINIKNPIKEINIVKKLVPYFNQRKYQGLLNGTNILKYYLNESNVTKISKGFYINFDGSIYPTQECIQEEKIGSIFGQDLSKEFNPNQFPNLKLVIPSEVFWYIKQNLFLREV
jgi:MoaA/NifB/PqqE/SkfB family radical SAM enzyme